MTTVRNPTLLEFWIATQEEKSIAYLFRELQCCHQAKNQVNLQQLTWEKGDSHVWHVTILYVQ